MTTRKVEETVRGVLARELELDLESVTEATSIEDTPQWTSVKHVEIVFAIEDHFAIEFSHEEIENMYSFKELVATIKQKL